MPSKADRVAAAKLAAEKRTVEQAISLSVALLRAGAVYDCLNEVVPRVDTHDPKLRLDAMSAMLRLENTPYSHFDALGSVYFGALYAVIEKWKKWKFSDAAVDEELKSERVGKLRELRHVVFHAGAFDDKAFRTFIEEDGALEWTNNLALALRSYLRRFHEDPETAAHAHLGRVGD